MPKRLFDLLAWLPGALFFFPIAGAIALAVLFEDGRPVLFRQARVGLKGRRFTVLKFRTMRDGKISRSGSVLRKCGLDELPQYLNILSGDMSFVGPRPLTGEDIERLGWTEARHAFRWRVRPGLTGLAQVFSGTGARRSLAAERLYCRRAGLALDLWIIGVSFLMNFLGKRRVQRALFGAIPSSGSARRESPAAPAGTS